MKSVRFMFFLRELGFEKCGAIRKIKTHISQIMGDSQDIAILDF